MGIATELSQVGAEVVTVSIIVPIVLLALAARPFPRGIESESCLEVPARSVPKVVYYVGVLFIAFFIMQFDVHDILEGMPREFAPLRLAENLLWLSAKSALLFVLVAKGPSYYICDDGIWVGIYTIPWDTLEGIETGTLFGFPLISFEVSSEADKAWRARYIGGIGGPTHRVDGAVSRRIREHIQERSRKD